MYVLLAASLFGKSTGISPTTSIIATFVTRSIVHACNGYNVCDNGWKLPLIYLVMFLPLMLTGSGKLSLDHAIKGWVWRGGND